MKCMAENGEVFASCNKTSLWNPNPYQEYLATLQISPEHTNVNTNGISKWSKEVIETEEQECLESYKRSSYLPSG